MATCTVRRGPVHVAVFLLPLLLGWMTMAPVRAFSFGERDPREKAVDELADTIQRELQRTRQEPWEAVYHGGIPAINATVTRLFLSSKRGFASRSRYSMDMGTVRRKGDRLILSSRFGDWGPRHITDTKEFVSVPWGARLYLIETNRIVEFCNEINAGDEPRKVEHEPFLLRENDWKKEVTSRPTIPKPWECKYLLKSPVECVVRTVGRYMEGVKIPEYAYTEGKANGIRATIDAGKERGLHPGMTLFPQRDLLLGTFYVLSCKADRAEVLLTRYLETEEE